MKKLNDLYNFYDGPVPLDELKKALQVNTKPSQIHAWFCEHLSNGIARRRLNLKAREAIEDSWLDQLRQNLNDYREQAIQYMTASLNARP